MAREPSPPPNYHSVRINQPEWDADMKKPRRSGCKPGLLRCVQCVGVPHARIVLQPRRPRCVLGVTVQCKILEHAILYRVEFGRE